MLNRKDTIIHLIAGKKETLRYFNYESSFELQFIRAWWLFKSQIPRDLQEVCSWNPPVVSGICDRNKYLARHHCSKKDVMWMSKYFPKPKFFGKNVKIELDLSSYATKADLKNWARVHTLDFA